MQQTWGRHVSGKKKKKERNVFGDHRNWKSSDFKPRRCILIIVWALLKWSLYSSTSIKACNGISAAFKQKTQSKVSLGWKCAGGDGTSQAGRQAGRAPSGWCSSALTGRWLMRRWCSAGHVHHAHWPVNWLSSAKHLAHQTVHSWPDLVQNTHPSYLLRIEAPSRVVLQSFLRTLGTFRWIPQPLNSLLIRLDDNTTKH